MSPLRLRRHQKARLLKRGQKKPLDGLSESFRRDLQSKGISLDELNDFTQCCVLTKKRKNANASKKKKPGS